MIRPFLILACTLLPLAMPAVALDSSGGVTAIAQSAGHYRDLSLSADWVLEGDWGPGRWLAYAEYSSTPRTDGVSAAYPQANADAGSALDADGQGRVQLSELHYSWAVQPDLSLSGGLMDTAAFIDRSRITNDETRHFLGAAFVNNPTIAFPDYTLGVALDAPLSDGSPWGGAVLVAKAKGLADDPSHAYSQLLAQEHGHGWFSAAVLRCCATGRTGGIGASGCGTTRVAVRLWMADQRQLKAAACSSAPARERPDETSICVPAWPMRGCRRWRVLWRWQPYSLGDDSAWAWPGRAAGRRMSPRHHAPPPPRSRALFVGSQAMKPCRSARACSGWTTPPCSHRTPFG